MLQDRCACVVFARCGYRRMGGGRCGDISGDRRAGIIKEQLLPNTSKAELL